MFRPLFYMPGSLAGTHWWWIRSPNSFERHDVEQSGGWKVKGVDALLREMLTTLSICLLWVKKTLTMSTMPSMGICRKQQPWGVPCHCSLNSKGEAEDYIYCSCLAAFCLGVWISLNMHLSVDLSARFCILVELCWCVNKVWRQESTNCLSYSL